MPAKAAAIGANLTSWGRAPTTLRTFMMVCSRSCLWGSPDTLAADRLPHLLGVADLFTGRIHLPCVSVRNTECPAAAQVSGTGSAPGRGGLLFDTVTVKVDDRSLRRRPSA
ncbi:hypothetical protein Acy02nite_42330 [Actinoplanes cyaneus]|uniref:Uncharacterized protein n=1 Tax=Actinoplanes cyaneus TaxID=52696 RepID=A0A919M564_9ACTN|nr:hypothetical protein Acy02nite_42330 [Actinoplanes cyaneus]